MQHLGLSSWLGIRGSQTFSTERKFRYECTAFANVRASAGIADDLVKRALSGPVAGQTERECIELTVGAVQAIPLALAAAEDADVDASVAGLVVRCSECRGRKAAGYPALDEPRTR
ncbi:MAG TPA: hypothetical protein VNA17_03690 [Pyrinomonadaceae bacterium]|nr:hypothetical protein [Pyrinomonadaceae bacterium]